MFGVRIHLSSLRTRIAEFWTRMAGENYYAEQYRQMHKNQAFRGRSWQKQIQRLEAAIPEIRSLKCLDFGCGPRGGIAEYLDEDKVISYDPFVERFSELPWNDGFDVVFSNDVLEHMTTGQISDFLTSVRNASPSYIFLSVTTMRASKLLPNRANVHLTVKPADWWLCKLQDGLGPSFRASVALVDLLGREATFCFCRSDTSAAHLN